MVKIPKIIEEFDAGLMGYPGVKFQVWTNYGRRIQKLLASDKAGEEREMDFYRAMSEIIVSSTIEDADFSTPEGTAEFFAECEDALALFILRQINDSRETRLKNGLKSARDSFSGNVESLPTDTKK